MRIRKASISSAIENVNPSFIIEIEFEFNRFREIPINFIGKISTSDGFKISSLSREIDKMNYQFYNDMSLSLETLEYENDSSVFIHTFSTELTSKAIDNIEKLRLANDSKSVIIILDLECTYLTTGSNQNNKRVLQAKLGKMQEKFTIEQSKWVQDYCEPLGIGKYLLIEFPFETLDTEYKKETILSEKLVRAKRHIKEMDELLKAGKWEKVIEESRKIWELLRLMDKELNSRSEIEKIFESNNYSSEGLDNLLKSLQEMHDYASKFLHEKDKKANLKPKVYAKREDAQFIYMWVIGLVNMLNEKLKNNDD